MAGPDAFSDIPLDQARALGAGSPAADRPIPFFERVKLGYQRDSAAEDWGANEVDWRGRAISEVVDGLNAKGVKALNPLFPGDPRMPGETDVTYKARQFERLFEQVARVRAADPGFLPDFAHVVDRDSFDQLVADRRSAEVERIDREAPGGLGAAGFIGAFVRRLRDPTSYIPVGGTAVRGAGVARQILVTGLRESVANVAITAATEPLVRGDARSLGIERTATDFLFDLGVSGAAGFTIGGGFAGAPHGIDALIDIATPLDRKVARAIRDAPLPDEPAPAMDLGVARAFARAVPPERRTPEQQAALNAIARDAEVRAQSPFVEGPAGDDAAAGWLDMALRHVTGEEAPRGPVRPVAREALAAGQADPASVRNPPRATLKAKIHRAEASASDDFNEASGATGPYQFVARTWVNLFRKRYPGDKRSFEQIAGLRRDPNLNELLMDDLIAENAAALKSAGLPETAGTLYLSHFLGYDKAIRVLKAAPDTPLGRLLPAEYFADNPWMKADWTAARLGQWAHGRMGGEAPVQLTDAGQAASIQPEEINIPDVDIPAGRYDVEAMLGISGDDRPILRPELFDGPESHAAAQRRFEGDRDAAEGFAPVRSADELFDTGAHLGMLRGHVAGGGKLTPEAIGEALGLSPDQARRVATAMAMQPGSPIMVSRGRRPVLDAEGNVTRAGVEPGGFIRRPKPPDRGPQSLLDFLSQRGIDDAGGELKMLGADRWHREGPFRRKLAREGGMAYDEALAAAIDAGYFPEYNKLRLTDGTASYADLPDLDVLFDAIDAEMRGNPRHLPDEHDELQARLRASFGETPEPDTAPLNESIADIGTAEDVMRFADERGVRLDEETLVHAVDAVLAGSGIDEALDDAIVAAAYRDLDRAATETGNAHYAIDDQGRRFSDDDINFAEPGEGEPGGGTAGGGAGRPGDQRLDAAADRAFAAQPQDGPEARGFDDPVGAAAVLQRESLEHDLTMAVGSGAFVRFMEPADRMALRLRWLGEQQRELGEARGTDKLREVELADKEPWLDPDYILKVYRNDPEAAEAHLQSVREWEEARNTTYRMDDEGEEADLASILDEIEAARKAAAEMRACLKPPKGPGA